MKKIVNFKAVYLFVVLFIMCVVVAFTGYSVKEESTKLGVNEIERDKVYTYMPKNDITFESPMKWYRVLRDSASGAGMFIYEYKADMLMVSDSGCLYVFRSIAYDMGEEDSISSLDGNEKIQFAENVKNKQIELLHRKYTLTSDVTSEYVKLADKEALVTSYVCYSKLDKEYTILRNYTFLNNGSTADIAVCLFDDKLIELEDDYEYLDKNTLPYLEKIQYGDTTKEHKEKVTFLVAMKRFAFPIAVLLILPFFILLCNATVAKNEYKFSGKTVWQEDPFGLDNSKSLLGFFAVMIVFHHIAQAAGEGTEIMGILENLGVCFVAGFFFFSGYGLIKSFLTKKDYLKGFFRKRLPGVLIPAYVCSAIYIVETFVSGKYQLVLSKPTSDALGEIGWLDFAEGILGIKLFNTQHWYIVEIVVLYILFYFFFRFIKNERLAMALMSVAVALLVVGSLLLGHGYYWFQGEWWYNSTLIFCVGMYVARYEEKVVKAIKSAYPFWVAMFAVLFVAFFSATKYMLSHHGYWTESSVSMGYFDKFATLAVQLPMEFFFIALVLSLLFKIKFQNKALAFLGKISLELYLIHNVFIQYATGIIGTGMYALFTVTGSIVLATVVHRFDTIVLCKLNKTPIPELPKLPRVDIEPKLENLKLRVRLGKLYVKRHPKRVVAIIFRSMVCIMLCAVAVVPIYLMFVNSSLSRAELIEGIHWFPGRYFMETYSGFAAYTNEQAGGVGASLLRSCLISGCSTVLAVYFGTACAYGFELFDFKGKKLLWRIIVAALMFSGAGSAIGYQRLVMKCHMLDTYIPLIIPAIATPSVAFFMRMYLKTIKPQSIVEAARIDGCSEIAIFNHIIVPMAKPAFSLLLLFNFVTSWNNSFMQSLVLTRPEQRTIALYLSRFASSSTSGTDPSIYMLLVVAVIPPLVVYLFLAKSIVSRIAIGAVKE